MRDVSNAQYRVVTLRVERLCLGNCCDICIKRRTAFLVWTVVGQPLPQLAIDLGKQ